ncbi:MAG TPA: HAMP domain-containing sensor histidine kinase [Prolixibacteraceae bacterium]
MPKRTANRFRWSVLLVIGLISLGLTFCWGPIFFPRPDQKTEAERIFKVFEEKEQRIKTGMEYFAAQLSTAKSVKELWLKTDKQYPESSGLYFTVSAHDSLLFWSSSLVAFDNKPMQIREEGSLRKMPTGWFYIFQQKSGDYKISGYMLIKRSFPYQNRYISSSFQEDFKLSDLCEVIEEEKPGTIQVFCREGKFHFGIQFKDSQDNTSQEAVPALIFFLIFVLMTAGSFHLWLTDQKFKPWGKSGRTIVFAASFYLLLNFLKLPAEVYAGRLFAPAHFAWGRLLSSMGDYLLFSFFLFFTAQSFFVFFRKERFVNQNSTENWGLYLFVSFYFGLTSGLFLILFQNSDVTLELYSNFSLSANNLLATSSIALQTVGLGILLIRIRCIRKREKSDYSFFLRIVVSTSLVVVVLMIFDAMIPLEVLIIWLVIAFILDRISLDLISRYKLTSLLVFGLLYAFCLNFVAQHEIEKRRANIQQLMAVNLAAERDPAAEIFLSDFRAKIVEDSIIQHFLVPPYQNLGNYLRENYFTGFWKNYEIQVTVCAAKDSLYLTEERKKFPCLDFFNQLKVSKGVELPGSDFYFMDRLNGRISYLGELHLFDKKNARPLMAFIDLNSRIVPEGKGYPQLLMDQQGAKRNRSEGYSYAKYFDHKLVDRGGSYLYDPVIQPETAFNREFSFFEKGGYSHCVYQRSGDNFVIISYPVSNLIEKGRGFPPLFLFIYLIGFLWILLNQWQRFISKNRFELRGKIQFTLVSTLLVLLFIIGAGLIRYNFLEFQRSMKETLDQKVRAISSELGLRIGNAVKLDSIHEYIEDQLIEISDIAWTDINVYDLKGRLMASSRNEIFEQGLTSKRMNPLAFRALSIMGGATFLHNENLGRMEFFSVYAPLFNKSDGLIGYVNLPYYNRQDEFTRQVSGFIVAFINLYILLVLLSVVIALAISSRLTVPLLQIEQKLKGIALGKQNARIEYQGEDEIGRLVQAYNQKVAELADSAALLARSERESAWKEMARQIAHEINNPLTPMKLNIQYLQKIKDQGAPNFDDYFNQVTRMLVAQIDALSAIAATFSDFARLPSTNIEPVEMKGLVAEVATLFNAPLDYSLKIIAPEGKIFISGDRDQLRRAIVNIIRNATQAIQNQDNGAILVRMELLDKTLKIAVTDNGTGISEADRSRLFEPNFTTKSGGTGLGLAITKSILENYKGEISFTSEAGNTTFYVNLPLVPHLGEKFNAD